MWSRWVELTSRTEAGTSLAVFRIAVGLCVVLNVAWVLWAGLVDVIWIDAAHGGTTVLHPGWLVRTLGGAKPEVMFPLAWATVGAGVLLALGLGGRITAFITLQLVMATVDINPLAGGSYDELLQNALWLCVLGSTTTTLSVDCAIQTGSWTSDRPVGAWARYLIVFQLVLMYCSTGMQKMSAYWTPGGDFSALYYILQQPGWHRFDMRWVADFFVLTQIGTAVSWFWEITSPLWLVAVWKSHHPGAPRIWSHVRWAYALIGIIFHVALLVFMEVGPFAPVTLAFYAALVHPREWREFWEGA